MTPGLLNTRGRGESILLNSADKVKELANQLISSDGATTQPQAAGLQSFKDIELNDFLASSLQQPILNELMPFKSSYACLDAKSNAVHILNI